MGMKNAANNFLRNLDGNAAAFQRLFDLIQTVFPQGTGGSERVFFPERRVFVRAQRIKVQQLIAGRVWNI